jgi:preprotein translocase subunit SecG
VDYNQFINLEYFFYKIYQFFAWIVGLLLGVSNTGDFFGNLSGFQGFLKIFFEILTIIFLTVIIYCLVRIYEVRKEEKAKLEKAHIAIDDEPYRNPQWDVVLKHVESDEPSDWRLAIIEADNMLDAMVKKMGYEGENLGDRLKAAEHADFESLDSAWDAHKMRNQIVHEGIGFEVTQEDAERVIKLYEKVFREFKYI